MTPLLSLGRFGLFVGAVARSGLRRPVPLSSVIQAAWDVGIKSLPILLIISAFVGTNLSLQGYDAFRQLGGQSLLGMFVALAGVRELAPIMVGAMVAAKAGTEMASAIAVHRTQEQIDALEVMAVDPLWYLVVPRLLGIVLVLPALTIVSIVNLIGCSWLVATLQLGLNGDEFLARVADTITGVDLVVCGIKAALFGSLISLISCYCGYTSAPGPAGVGRATNLAVVLSAVACAILNYFVSEVAYG